MTNRYDEKERRIHCAFSEKCGGCDYAGMKYDNELAVKQKYIEELFGEYVKVDDIVGMYRPIYYRNKVHAVVGLDDSRNVIAGTYEENSHRIVDTLDCMIEDSQCTDIIKDIKGLIASFKYQPYDEDAGKGMIRHILLRKGFSTKEIMLVIVTAGVTFPSKNNFLKVLCEKHPEITTIVQNINDRRTSMVLGKRNIVLKGKGYIEDVLCGCRFRISPTSFYQINHQQTEKLYKKAIQLADISKNDTVIDERTDKVGFRNIKFDAKKGFLINGKHVKLNGVCLHHDGGCVGAAVPPEIWRRRLEKLKDMGVNSVRCSHNPPDEALLDLCDELGLLMMDEAFDEWENPKNKWSTGHNVYPPKHEGYAEDFPEWHERDLADMVRRDRNHPSIVMWSIGNEIDYPNDPYCHPLFETMTGNNDANKPAKERQYDPK